MKRIAATTRYLAPLAAALLALATVADAGAQIAVDGGSEATRGATLYRIHCASCHGESGQGDGPVASSLRHSPTDLTRLAERDGGKFDETKVAAAIDGRTEVRAHGRSEMPVWGLSFAQRGRDSAQEAEVEAQIEALVAYLKQRQRR